MRILLIATLFAFSGMSFRPAEKINWITPDQLAAAYAKEPRPILVDLYTDWCGWCKVMDKKTYANENVSRYINQKYYAIKFNAESTGDVSFNGKIYKYNSRYKTHDLALYLSQGKLAYPNTVFLTSPDARPAPLEGFLKPSEFEAPLKYFGEKAYSHQSLQEFMNSMKKEWR